MLARGTDGNVVDGMGPGRAVGRACSGQNSDPRRCPGPNLWNLPWQRELCRCDEGSINSCMKYCHISMVLVPPLVLEFTSEKYLPKIVGDGWITLREIDISS